MNLKITISLKNSLDSKINFYKQVAEYITEIKFIEYVPDSKELTLACMKFTNLSALCFYQLRMHPKRTYKPVEIERTVLIVEENLDNM